MVIGGGDTGSDCVGTCNRHGAAKITQIEIMPKPPVHDNPQTPWPMYPMVLKTSSSHEEGCERRWLLNAIRFIGEKNRLKAVEVEEVTWKRDENGRMQMLPTGKKRSLMPIWYFWQWALYTLHWRELFPSWGLLWMLGKI